MTTAPRPRRSRRRKFVAFLALALAGTVVGVAAITTDTLGAGKLFDRAMAKVDRFVAGPVPGRAAPGTVLVTDPPGLVEEPDPDESPAGSPGTSPVASIGPSLTPVPVPGASATPRPVRRAVDVDIVQNDKAVFAHQLDTHWCAPAGIQITLAILGLGDTSHAFQRTIAGRVREWESLKDSRNGDWGPSAIALALDAYGAKGYEVRAYKTRQGALRDAARAIMRTNSPVLLIAWKGAHTWVMSGFRANADPTLFADATISGTYILDPWYPDWSSIWGQSDGPGVFQNSAEMVRNYLPWKRPEGKYPDRDGLYIAVVPTIRAGSAQ
jgi:hypothetical protein